MKPNNYDKLIVKLTSIEDLIHKLLVSVDMARTGSHGCDLCESNEDKS